MDIKDFLSQIPILEVAERLGMKLEGNKALCYGGHDSTPSLTFYPVRQGYYCWGCHQFGDSADLVGHVRGLDLRESLDYLCGMYGLRSPLSKKKLTPAEKKVYAEHKEVCSVLMATAKWYHSQLSDEVMSILTNRYRFTTQTINDIRVGYAPAHGLIAHLKSKDFSHKQMLSASVVSKGDSGLYDTYRDRIVFPYWQAGKVTYLNARAIGDAQPKYFKLPMHSEKRKWVSPTLAQPLYIHAGRDKSRLLVPEGITDTILAIQEGYSVASSTSTMWTANAIKRLSEVAKKYPETYICFDSDENGSGLRAARILSASLARVGTASFIVQLPMEKGGTDLNDYLGAKGKEATDYLISTAASYLSLSIEEVKPAEDLALTASKLTPVMESLAYHQPVDIDVYCSVMAKRYGLAKASLKRTVTAIQTQRLRVVAKNSGDAPEYEHDPVVIGLHDTLWHGLCNLRYKEEVDTYGETKLVQRSPGATTHETASYLYGWLHGRKARFYYDKARQVAFFYTNNNDCIYLEDGDVEFMGWWLKNIKYTSIKESEIVRGLSQFIYGDQRTKHVESFLWGATLTDRIYWNLCDDKHQVLCITKDKMTVAKNGDNCDDMVFSRPALLKSPAMPVKDDKCIGALKAHFTDKLLLRKLDAEVLTACLVASLLPGLKQRPILHMLGNQGSGKSTAAEMMYRLLYGDSRITAPSDSEELWSSVDGNPLFAHDNIESDDHSKFRGDYLLMPTGAAKVYRKLFTNAGQITYNPNAQVVWTSIEPVTLVEALQRIIIFDFDVDYADGPVTKDSLFTGIDKHRDEMMSGVWQLFQRMLNKPEMVVEYFHRLCGNRHPKERFNDYLRLVMFFFVELSPLNKKEAEDHFMQWMRAQSADHLDLEGHGNPIISYLRFMKNRIHLSKWSAHVSMSVADGVATISASASGFFYAFQILHRLVGAGRFPYRNANVLGRRIKSSGLILEAEGWEYNYVRGRASNMHVFRFVPEGTQERML